MPLIGRIPFPLSISYPSPSGMLANIAVDGTHHIIARAGNSSNFVDISCAETLTQAAESLTEADVEADIGSELGVVEDTDPPAGGSGFFAYLQKVGCPGTRKFYTLVQNFSNDELSYQILGIRYSIAAEGSLTIDGHCRYLTVGDGLIGGQFGGALGQEVIGDDVCFIADCESETSIKNCHLIKLPINSNQVVLTANSWATHRYDLPGDMGLKDWWPSSAGDKKSLATLFEHPDGVGVLAYRTSFDDPSVLYFTVVSGNTTNTGQNDISSQFGIPFDDEGKNFAGTPTAFGDDWYSNPCINVLSDGRLEIMMVRGYSDNDGVIGVRWFTANSDLSDIQNLGFFQVDLTEEVGASFEDGHARREGNSVIFMIREDSALTFMELEIPEPGICPSSGFDLTYPPCVTAWTQCVKIQRRDGVSFRFTSLDQDLEFRGETYVTCGGLDPSATQITAQLGEVGSAELAGLITASGIEEAELYGGLFDDAFVEIWLVPYEGEDTGEANIPRRLSAGWAGKVSHSTRGYKMEVLGPGARLDQRPIVQVYSPQCRWVFGDERCGVDIDSMAIVGTVTSPLNRGSFLADLGDPLSSGTGAPESSGTLPAQFANGKVRWLTGVNAGQITEVKSVDFDTGAIILWALTCFVPEIGDSFDLLPGCAQDFETCQTAYDNAIAFGGFPHVPGRDAIMESPNAKNG